jgi:hypothetical protein
MQQMPKAQSYCMRVCMCKYLEIRPSPDRSPPGPSVEKHSGQETFSEQPDTVVPHTVCGFKNVALPLCAVLHIKPACGSMQRALLLLARTPRRVLTPFFYVYLYECNHYCSLRASSSARTRARIFACSRGISSARGRMRMNGRSGLLSAPIHG